MNINLKGIAERVKNNSFSIAILVFALVFAANSFKKQMKTVESLQAKIKTEAKKNESLLLISKLEKKFLTFKKTVNNKNMANILNNIGNLARSSGLTISSIRPQGETDYDVYIEHAFDLEFAVHSFHSLGEFISRLERSEEIYMIKELNLKVGSLERKAKAGQEEGILVDMRLVTPLITDGAPKKKKNR